MPSTPPLSVTGTATGTGAPQRQRPCRWAAALLALALVDPASGCATVLAAQPGRDPAATAIDPANAPLAAAAVGPAAGAPAAPDQGLAAPSSPATPPRNGAAAASRTDTASSAAAVPRGDAAPVVVPPPSGPATGLPSRGAAPSPGNTAAPLPGSTAAPLPGTTPAPLPPITPARFQQLLRSGDLDALDPACRQLAAEGDAERLRLLRQHLLRLYPAPQPLAVVLANADVLLSCRLPQAALEVLNRISPAAGGERLQWLILQWRAANAALDHRRAALALQRLAAGRPARLESLLLPLQQRQDGSWVSRPALELLAFHLEARGQSQAAASLLLLSSRRDGAAAERLGQALRLLADLPASVRDPLFERALEQAAAVGAWGLVSELLSAQAALPASAAVLERNRERRLRLSRRLDDAYGQWRTLAEDPAAEFQRRQLEQQLRSPQAPGGHAADWPVPASDPPAGAPAAAVPAAAGSRSPSPLP